jgi:hypothetical protein
MGEVEGLVAAVEEWLVLALKSAGGGGDGGMGGGGEVKVLEGWGKVDGGNAKL